MDERAITKHIPYKFKHKENSRNWHGLLNAKKSLTPKYAYVHQSFDNSLHSSHNRSTIERKKKKKIKSKKSNNHVEPTNYPNRTRNSVEPCYNLSQ